MLNLTRGVCLLAVLLTSWAASGCAGQPTVIPPTPVQVAIASTAPDFCATAKPIYINKGDVIVDDTARQILAHNKTGRKLCGW